MTLKVFLLAQASDGGIADLSDWIAHNPTPADLLIAGFTVASLLVIYLTTTVDHD